MITLQDRVGIVSLTEAQIRNDEMFKNGGHVSLVFSDGEHTSTKAGVLYGQRNFHCLASGHPTRKLPADWFPQRMGQHAFVWCTYKDAEELATMIREELGKEESL